MPVPSAASVRPTALEAFAFACKAAVAAVAALLVYKGFICRGFPGRRRFRRSLDSQPGWQPSVHASFYRLVANMIGACFGALLVTLLGETSLALVLGVLATGLVCHYLRFDDALRPAYASVVIVILTSKGSVWWGSLDRVLGVLVGCSIALGVGLLFDRIMAGRHRKPPPARPVSE